MSNNKNEEAVLTNVVVNKEEPISIPRESSFVTPGIFRRRKMLTSRQVTEEGTNEDFKWTIDHIAKIRPMEFDETEEFSLPPENWDPSAKFNASGETVDQFWTHNTFIAPSPEVFTAAASSRRDQPSSDSPTSSAHHFTLSPFGSGLTCSSKTSLSNSMFMSPTMILTHSQMSETNKTKKSTADENQETMCAGDIGDTKENMIADGSEDFEQLERSLSFEVADSIAADLDDGEGFVFMEMRKEGPSVDPI